MTEVILRYRTRVPRRDTRTRRTARTCSTCRYRGGCNCRYGDMGDRAQGRVARPTVTTMAGHAAWWRGVFARDRLRHGENGWATSAGASGGTEVGDERPLAGDAPVPALLPQQLLLDWLTSELALGRLERSTPR